MIDYNMDGIEHVNIYSKARTELGRMLSNFYRFHIITANGEFESVEGYWHWLGIEECPEKEKLRTLYWYEAKKYGTDLKKIKKKIIDMNFEHKILSAILYKIQRNTHLFTPELINLPFEHYYLFGSKVNDVKNKYLWMIEGIDKIRNYYVQNGR